MVDLSNQPAKPDEYLALRGAAGLSVFSQTAAEIALQNTLHGVWLRDDGTLVGMGRLIGDGGCFAQLTDIAVHPDYQRQGLGNRIVGALMSWAEVNLPNGCYVSLIADPGAERLYENHGFDYRTGMARTLG